MVYLYSTIKMIHGPINIRFTTDDILHFGIRVFFRNLPRKLHACSRFTTKIFSPVFINKKLQDRVSYVLITRGLRGTYQPIREMDCMSYSCRWWSLHMQQKIFFFPKSWYAAARLPADVTQQSQPTSSPLWEIQTLKKRKTRSIIIFLKKVTLIWTMFSRKCQVSFLKNVVK